MRLRSLCLSAVLVLTGSLAAIAQGPAYPYSVALSWTISTSTVVGQNVYRAPYTASCGAFTKLNGTQLPSTQANYTDTTVVPNTGYCYQTTAVSAGGIESGPSNVLQNIQIPPAPPTGLTSTTQ